MAFDGRGPDSAVSGPCARIIHDHLSSDPSTPSSFSYPSPSSSTSDLRSRPPSYSETIMHGPHRMPSTSSFRPRPLPVPPTLQPSSLIPLIPSMPSRPPTPLSPSRPSSASSTATSFSFRPLPTVPVPIFDPAPPPRANAAPLDLTMLAPPAGPLSPDAVSPLSPCGPPPPHEIRRQNLSKLRRYLGQSVPPALVYRDSEYSSGDSSGDEGESTEEITFRVHLEQDEVDETRREGGQRATPGPRPAICEAEAARARPLWTREQNGKRWVEEDFGQILHALRNLR